MHPYIPLNTLESMAAERRADPRVIAAAGYPLTGSRRKPRHSLGALLVRFGRWVEGTRREHVPVATPAAALAMAK
jgi:hypothetical protein